MVAKLENKLIFFQASWELRARLNKQLSFSGLFSIIFTILTIYQTNIIFDSEKSPAALAMQENGFNLLRFPY
jgi:FtsH-binding integral membrane protein